jgi:drug/metabolite transporter (DMT)-like permease
MNKQLKTNLLFIVPSFIWGSTWYAIKFQLGSVNPMLSVSYRFALAGLILILICIWRKKEMSFGIRTHFLFFLQGLLLFGINYWLVYEAEQYLTSGLIAVIFSIIVFTNAVFGAIFIKSKITLPLIIGGFLAIGGTILIFLTDVSLFLGKGLIFDAVLMSFGALIFASLGNVASAYNQQKKLPLLQSNAYSMLYGSVFIFLAALVLKTPITFEFHTKYLLSLTYLAIFGSVIAFSSYLEIIGRIGPAKASYAIVFTPVIAMIFSTIFESYSWQKTALIGMPVLILGNLIAMEKINLQKISARWK